MTVKITNFLGGGDPVRDGAWTTNLIADLSQILFYIFAVVGAVAIIYAVYLGFLLAKASDEKQRSVAKRRIHHAVASLMIIVLLVTALFTVGFTEAFFQNVRDINYYSLSKAQFTLGDIRSGAPRNTVSLVQNNTTLVDNVAFKISAEETGHGHSHSSDLIHITPAGTISASTGASGIIYIFVDVSYKGETKLTHKMITIYDETANPIDPVEPETPFIPTDPGGTLPEPQSAMFQNPVDYKSTDSYLEYFGSNHAPYVMSNFLDAAMVPEYSSPNTFGTTSSSLGTLAENKIEPHVLFNRYTGLVFHNMGATSNSRSIYAARIGKVTKVYNGVADTNSSAYHGYGNYIEIRHEIDDYDYGFDIHKWVVPLIKGKIIIPTSDIADNLLGRKKVFYTRYNNLKQNSINVKVGDIVGGKVGETFSDGRVTIRPYGQAIASMGKTGYLFGSSTSNQMYFQVYTYVDARNWLSSLIGQAFDLITGDDEEDGGGKYTHTVYINPFKDDEIVFVDNSELAKQIKKAKKKKKAWIVYDVNGGYQMFNGAGGLIDSILEKGYKSLFNKDIQEAITALENGDFKQFIKKEVRELLNEETKQQLENFLYQKVADVLGAQYSSVLKKIVDGNFKGLINPAITGDLTQLLSFSMYQILDEYLLESLEKIRTGLSPETNANLNVFLNTKVEMILDMLDAQERIAKGEIPGPLTVPQRALQQTIAALMADSAFESLLVYSVFKKFQVALRLDLNDLINGNQYAYNAEARSYVTILKSLQQAKIISAIPKNVKYVVETGDWTSVLNPDLQVAAQNVLDGNVESLLDGGLNGALNVLDQSGSLSKLLNFDYKGLIDEIKNFSVEGELERQIRIILERVLSPEIYQVLEAIWEDNWWSLVKPEVKAVVDLVMGKPVKDVISDVLRAKLEAIANDPTNNLTPTQRTYIRIFLDAGLKQVLKFARNNAPDENDILDQDVKNAIDLLKNEEVMAPNLTPNEYQSVKIVIDVDFSKLFPKVVEDPEENEKLMLEQQNAQEAFKNVRTDVEGEEIAPLYDGTVFVSAAKNVTEGFVTDLWLCKGTCGSQWTNYSDYDPPYCKYCKSYDIQNISASQNMTEMLNPVLRDALREIRDVGIEDLLNQGWDKIVVAVGKLKPAFKKIVAKFDEFAEKTDTPEEMKEELQKVMKTLMTPDSYSVFEDVTNGDFSKLLDGKILESLKSFFKIQMRDIIADDLKTALLNIRGQLTPVMQEHLDNFLKADVYAMLNYNNQDGKEQTPEQIETQTKLKNAIAVLKTEPKFSTMGITLYEKFLVVLTLDLAKFTSGETEFAYNTSARGLITKLMVLFDIIRDFSGKPLQDVLRDLSFTDMWVCNYCHNEWENIEEGNPAACNVCHSNDIKKKPIDDRLMAIFPPPLRNAINNAMKGDFSEIFNGELDRAIDSMGGLASSFDAFAKMELDFGGFIDMAKNIDLTQMLAPDAAYVFKDLFNISTWNYVKDKFNYLTNGGMQVELKRLGQDARDLWRDSKDAAIKFFKQDLKDYFKSDEFESDILSLFSSELKDAVAVYKNVKGGFENGWKTPDGEMDWGAIKDAANSFVDLLFNGGWTSWKTAKELGQRTTKDGTPASFGDAFNEAFKDLSKGLETHVTDLLNKAMAEIYGFVYKCSNGHQSTIMPEEGKCKTCGETVKEYTYSCENGHLFESMPSGDKCTTCSTPVKQLGLNGILHSLDNRLADVYMNVLKELEGDLLTISTELNTATQPVGEQIVDIVDKYIKMSEIMETMLIALAQEYYTARASLWSSVAIIHEDNGATSGGTIDYEKSTLLVNIRGGEIRYYENDDGTRVEVPAHIAPGRMLRFLNAEELRELITVLLTDNYVIGELYNDVIDEMIADDPEKFKEEENEEDGSVVLFHKPDDEWEEITPEDFLTEYETDIEARYEAKLQVFLDEMEGYISPTAENKYTGVDSATVGLDRINEISTITELREVALYMINYVFGGDPTKVITKDTCLKIKNNWWKKVFKAICTAIGWIATAITVVAGIVALVAACITGAGAVLAPLILKAWVIAVIGVVGAAGHVGAANTDRIIPDKVVIGGDISIAEHAKRIVGDPRDFGYDFSNFPEYYEIYYEYYSTLGPTSEIGKYLTGAALDIDFNDLPPEVQEAFLNDKYTNIVKKFDKEDYSKRILKFYITKIDEGLDDEQKVSGKIMGDAASELIEPRVDEMQEDINELMDKELVEMNKKIEDIVGNLEKKTHDILKAELKKMELEVDAMFDRMLIHFEGLGGSVEDLFAETLEDLVQDLTEILIEMLLKEILGDLINSFCGDLSGVMSLIFPPDPISWYYPYERAIQIDVVEGVLAYFGLGGKWADVVQSVVRNVPYQQHYQQGAAVPA